MRHWTDHLLHAALRTDGEVARRARLTVLLAVVLIGVAGAYAAVYAAVVGYLAGARILLAGVAGVAAAAVLLRLRPWLQTSGQLVTLALYGVIVGLMLCEGGVRALATPLLSLPPTLAALLLGRRSAAGWAVLSVLTVVVFGVLDAQGIRFPARYPVAWEPRMSVGSPVGLVLCTTLLLLVFEDVRAQAQARADAAGAALARMAYHDALTGLANRARFLEQLGTTLAAAHGSGEPARVAVLLLDLDGFKAVNDTLGHAAGDALLQQVAARLLAATRGCDTVARLGGDEFAVLLGAVRGDGDAATVADRIVDAIGRPFDLPTGTVTIGVSLGVARAAARPTRAASPAGTATPADGAVAAVLHDADVAMYRAKSLGRGRWVRHEASAPAIAIPPAAAAPMAPEPGRGGRPHTLPVVAA